MGTRYQVIVGAGRPEATTVKVALSPAVTDTEDGPEVMTGGWGAELAS